MSQTQGSSRLVGTWKLVAAQTEFENKEREDIYGEASGFLIITADGRMAALLADNARQSSDPPGSLFDRMMAYSGRYRVQGDDTLIINIDLAWHPSWFGTEQTRFFKVDGDMLSIVAVNAAGSHPKYPGRTVRGVLTWRRE